MNNSFIQRPDWAKNETLETNYASSVSFEYWSSTPSPLKAWAGEGMGHCRLCNEHGRPKRGSQNMDHATNCGSYGRDRRYERRR